MSEHYLNLGELVVTNQASRITCYGLGSCVGLFIYDRQNKIAAGAHIVLSGELEKDTTYNAQTAFNQIMEKIKSLGGNINGLRAKIVGGASLFSTNFQTGTNNVNTISQLLLQNRIYVAAKDVGGTVSRTAKFDSTDGSLTILSSSKRYTI